MTYWERFKENAQTGCASYRKHSKWSHRIVLTLAFPLAPLFWAWFALFRDEEEDVS